MMKKIAILPLVAFAAACANHQPYDELARGMNPVNQPVVTQQSYAFDVTTTAGTLSGPEAQRLDSWFRSMKLGYGDAIYVDGGPAAASARQDIARIAGRYGLQLSEGAPVTASQIAPGSARVIVTRTQASVPGCPNWSEATVPNWNNRQMPGLGCGVNSNLAAMVASPEDLIRGREGSSTVDVRTSSRAVGSYRDAEPTGEGGLEDVSTGGAQGGRNSGGGN